MTCYLNEMIKRTATLAAGGFSVLNSAPTHPEFFFFFFMKEERLRAIYLSRHIIIRCELPPL